MTESPECYVRWEGQRSIDVARARQVWRDLKAGPNHDEGCLCPSCKRKLHRAQGGHFSRETFFYSWLELEAQLSLVPQQDYTVFRRRPLADEERTSVEWADLFPWITRCSGVRPAKPGAKPSKCPNRDKCIHARFTKKPGPVPSEWEGATERPRRGRRPKTRKRGPTVVGTIAAFLREHFPDVDANPKHIRLTLWRFKKAGVEERLEEEIRDRQLRAAPPDPGAWQNLRLAQRVADLVYSRPERTIPQRDLQRSKQARVSVDRLEALRPWLFLNYGIEAKRGRRKGQWDYVGRLKDARGRVLHVGVGRP